MSGQEDDENKQYDCSHCKANSLYTHRNCVVDFPELAEVEKNIYLPSLKYWYTSLTPPHVWKATYKVTGYEVPTVSLDDVISSECPKSISRRNPELKTLVRIITQAEKLAAKYGSPLGPPSRWSGSFYDAVLALEVEKQSVKYAVDQLKPRS